MCNISYEKTAESFFGNIISTYSRTQAIEDADFDPFVLSMANHRLADKLAVILHADIAGSTELV